MHRENIKQKMVIRRDLGLREIGEKGCEKKRFENLYLQENLCSQHARHASITRAMLMVLPTSLGQRLYRTHHASITHAILTNPRFSSVSIARYEANERAIQLCHTCDKLCDISRGFLFFLSSFPFTCPFSTLFFTCVLFFGK